MSFSAKDFLKLYNKEKIINEEDNFAKYNKHSSDYKKHKFFTDTCLEPRGYIHGRGEVFVKIVEVERFDSDNEKHANSTYVQVHLSVLTPMMAYTDYLYFMSQEEKWWKEIYRPYYFEFVFFIDESDPQWKKIAEKHQDHNWFRAKIKTKPKNGIRGVLSFGIVGGLIYNAQVVLCEYEEDGKQVDYSAHILDFKSLPIYKPSKDLKEYIRKNIDITDSYTAKIINVGQANCIYFVDKAKGVSFFFDIGKPINYYNGDLVKTGCVWKNLKKLKECEPRCVFISHWHFDHVNAFVFLNAKHVRCDWIVPDTSDSSIRYDYTRLKAYIMKNGNSVYYYSNNSCIYNGGINSFELWQGQNAHNLNDKSIILRVGSILFPADSLYTHWPNDLQANIKNINILQVPHHCSKLDSGNDNVSDNKAVISKFIVAKDKKAIICTGKNGYGHPNINHKKELGQKKFKIYMTGGKTSNVEFIEINSKGKVKVKKYFK